MNFVLAASVLYIGPLITILLILAIVYIALKLGKALVYLALNSVIGLIALGLLNLLPFLDIKINIWSILIVALGGIPGLVLVVLLDLLGVAF